MPALLLTFFLLLQAAFAGPSWQAAPDAGERPVVPAPPGGWWTEHGLYVNVHGGQDDHTVVRRLADHAATSLPRLSRLIGVEPGSDIDVYVAAEADQFDSMQPGIPPEWADGTAWPNWGLIFLRAPSIRPGTAEPLEQVLDHELVHILVGRAFAPRTPPRWLQEGLAQFWTGELDPSVATRLSSVVFGRERLFSLNQLSGSFYGDPVRAAEGYAASADFMGFLTARYGEDAVRTLVAEMAGGKAFPDALRVVTGKDMEAVEAEWSGRWTDPAAIFGAVLSTDVLWGFAGVLAVIGAFRVRRRARKKLDRWEREERWLMSRSNATDLDGYVNGRAG